MYLVAGKYKDCNQTKEKLETTPSLLYIRRLYFSHLLAIVAAYTPSGLIATLYDRAILQRVLPDNAGNCYVSNHIP